MNLAIRAKLQLAARLFKLNVCAVGGDYPSRQRSDAPLPYAHSGPSLKLRALVVIIAGSILTLRSLQAEDRIIDQPPHDLLTLKQDAQMFKLVPLEMKRRQPLSEKDRGEWLRVRLLKRPAQQYQVHWRDIDRVQLFEELVLQEAVQMTKLNDFDGAHACYRYIDRHAPGFPGLADARHQSLFREAEYWLGQGHFANALGLLNELYERERRFTGLKEVTGRVVDRLVEEYLSTGKYAAARQLLDRLAAKYEGHPVGDARRQQLVELSNQSCQLARTAADAGELREAHDLVRKASSIWPELRAARELTAELNSKYPILRVGVREPWSEAGFNPPANWANRRCRPLVDRYLFLPQGFGPDGGVYESAIVTHKNDGNVTTLTINEGVRWPTSDRSLSSMDVGRQLMARMESWTPGGSMPLSSAVESLRMLDTTSLQITWRAPQCVWQGKLSIPIRRSVRDAERLSSDNCLGPYQAEQEKDGHWRFTLRSGAYAATARQPREISEKAYRDTLSALQALRNQEILVYDRVVPWDVKRVRAYDDLKVVPYATPTVHLLVPNPNSPALASGVVRRAISLALDRASILCDELGDGNDAVGKLLSGPFPRGYAYDESVEVCVRDARLAAGLLREARGLLEKRSVRLVHASDPVVRRAVRAMQEQLKLDGLGLDVELVEMPHYSLADGPVEPWDLWYVEWNAMDPSVDAELLLGPGTVIGRGDPRLQSMLHSLGETKSWEDLRAALHKIHRCVNQRLLVIPLWQLDEFAVVHRSLDGVGNEPVSLYRNVEQWRVKSE